jgi:hypothetical protein
MRLSSYARPTDLAERMGKSGLRGVSGAPQSESLKEEAPS